MDNLQNIEPRKFDLNKFGHLEMFRAYVKALEIQKVFFSVDISGTIRIVIVHQ